MPFEDDEKDLDNISKKNKVNASSQKSIFDNKPKKPNQEDFITAAKQINESLNSYKTRAAELGAKFRDMFYDKTLKDNKSVISKDFEREILGKMLSLAQEINNDENEPEGMGSLGWIALLLNMTLTSRDRMNYFEFQQEVLNSKFKEMDKNIKVILEKLSALDTDKKDV